MSSRWVLESDGDKAEPVSFDRLAQMLADGRLQDADLVRPEHGGDWQTADSVIGLIRAAWRLQDAGRLPSADANQAVASGGVDRLPVHAGTHEPLKENCANPGAPGFGATGVGQGRSISVPRTVFLTLLLAAAGWFAWSRWHASRRFPVPAHVRSQPAPWTLPLIGPVSGFEVALLGFDVIVVISLALWWIRTRKRQSSSDQSV